MKMTIDGKVCDVSFLSFFKGYVLSGLFSALLFYGGILIIYLIIA